MTACSLVTVTGRPLSGGSAVDTNEASEVGSPNCEVASELSANRVNAVRAPGLFPSSRLISTRVARPAAVVVGSGRSTCRPMPAGGPPSAAGSSTSQPTGAAKIRVFLATLAGVAIISGDSATCTPVGWTTRAPWGKLRATSTHRLESGTQASTGAPLRVAWPSICPATVAAGAAATWTSTQRPPAACCWRLKLWATRPTAGARSSLTATLSSTGWLVHEA
jgi:hypothetical protein